MLLGGPHERRVDPLSRREGRNRFRGLEAVDEEAELGRRSHQAGRARQLIRSDADGVLDVGYALGSEIFCLPKRRDGDAAMRRIDRHARRLDRLQSLHVRPKRDAQAMAFLDHPRAIALELGPVERERGRRNVSEVHDAQACSFAAGRTPRRI